MYEKPTSMAWKAHNVQALEKMLDTTREKAEPIRRPILGFLSRAAGWATTRLLAPPATASANHTHWREFPE